MTSRYKDHVLGPDTHANRPLANAVPEAAQYSCNTHNLIYKSVSGSWVTYAVLVASGAAMPAGGATGQMLTKNSNTDYDANWVTPTSTKVINAQTLSAYTLALADANRTAFLTMSNAAASTVTVPPNSSVAFPVGALVEGAQLGAGQVTLTPGAGVTINGSPGLKIAAQYGTFALVKLATDTWLAMGRLSA